MPTWGLGSLFTPPSMSFAKFGPHGSGPTFEKDSKSNNLTKVFFFSFFFLMTILILTLCFNVIGEGKKKRDKGKNKGMKKKKKSFLLICLEMAGIWNINFCHIFCLPF